jgi:hypothetical protein
MSDVHSCHLWAPDDSHGIRERCIRFSQHLAWKRRDIVVGTYLLSETLTIQCYPDSVETVLPGLLEVVHLASKQSSTELQHITAKQSRSA